MRRRSLSCLRHALHPLDGVSTGQLCKPGDTGAVDAIMRTVGLRIPFIAP